MIKAVVRYLIIISFFNILTVSKGFSQDTTLSARTLNGNYNIIVTINNKQLKTIFLNDIGTAISEKSFYDSVFTDKYIYKKHGNTVAIHNSIFINQKGDSAILQLENKINYFHKNIGTRIPSLDYFKINNLRVIKDNRIAAYNQGIVIYVFSSGCPSCVERMLSLDSLYKRGGQIDFLTLMTDSGKSVNKFYRRNNLRIPFFVNQDTICGKLPVGCDELPFFLITDGDGLIVDCFDGDENGIARIKSQIKQSKE